ncbi:MAG: hypothetical protein ACE5PO_01630 [Candidatus Bathyarchaeia archaeon]
MRSVLAESSQFVLVTNKETGLVTPAILCDEIQNLPKEAAFIITPGISPAEGPPQALTFRINYPDYPADDFTVFIRSSEKEFILAVKRYRGFGVKTRDNILVVFALDGSRWDSFTSFLSELGLNFHT